MTTKLNLHFGTPLKVDIIPVKDSITLSAVTLPVVYNTPNGLNNQHPYTLFKPPDSTLRRPSVFLDPSTSYLSDVLLKASAANHPYRRFQPPPSIIPSRFPDIRFAMRQAYPEDPPDLISSSDDED